MYQESKAEKAIEALQEMTSGASRVCGAGSERAEARTRSGDVILIDAGDAITRTRAYRVRDLKWRNQR